PDHSLAAGSPGHIAGSSVLHRLLVPRHPPCALKNLAHTTYALQQLRRGPPRHAGRSRIDARVHCAVLKKRTAPAPSPPAGGTGKPSRAEKTRRPAGAPVPSGPNSVPTPAALPPPRSGPRQGGDVLNGRRRTARVNSQRSTRK